MRALELKIPPPLVALSVMVLMWLATELLPQLQFALPGREIVAPGLGSLGFVVAALGVLSFRRARTTINPHKPATASAMVVSGVYRFTRNPMYLGIFIALFGWAVFLSNAAAFLLAPLFILYMSRFQIIPEERALAAIFGDEHAAYMAKVRRWL
ncbi:MAG: methyltransferase family protein [Betaproteobacteria bacterium]